MITVKAIGTTGTTNDMPSCLVAVSDTSNQITKVNLTWTHGGTESIIVERGITWDLNLGESNAVWTQIVQLPASATSYVDMNPGGAKFYRVHNSLGGPSAQVDSPPTCTPEGTITSTTPGNVSSTISLSSSFGFFAEGEQTVLIPGTTKYVTFLYVGFPAFNSSDTFYLVKNTSDKSTLVFKAKASLISATSFSFSLQNNAWYGTYLRYFVLGFSDKSLSDNEKSSAWNVAKTASGITATNLSFVFINAEEDNPSYITGALPSFADYIVSQGYAPQLSKGAAWDSRNQSKDISLQAYIGTDNNSFVGDAWTTTLSNGLTKSVNTKDFYAPLDINNNYWSIWVAFYGETLTTIIAASINTIPSTTQATTTSDAPNTSNIVTSGNSGQLNLLDQIIISSTNYRLLNRRYPTWRYKKVLSFSELKLTGTFVEMTRNIRLNPEEFDLTPKALGDNYTAITTTANALGILATRSDGKQILLSTDVSFQALNQLMWVEAKDFVTALENLEIITVLKNPGDWVVGNVPFIPVFDGQVSIEYSLSGLTINPS